jgi:molecular chaperone DnaJ
LSVKIPAGVETGNSIRLTGEGELGSSGGPPGDLYVYLMVEEHALFKREQDNLYCEMPVSFATAVLGGDLEVPTLDGRASIKVPAGTQSEKLFRLRGKGVRNVRSGQTGDLYCRISVETPVNLTAQQKELLQEFEKSVKEGGTRHSPREASWVDKIKGLFG